MSYPHRADGVIESSVGCGMENKVRGSELLDVAQPLERRRVNNLALESGDKDVAMHVVKERFLSREVGLVQAPILGLASDLGPR